MFKSLKIQLFNHETLNAEHTAADIHNPQIRSHSANPW